MYTLDKDKQAWAELCQAQLKLEVLILLYHCDTNYLPICILASRLVYLHANLLTWQIFHPACLPAYLLAF